MRGIFTYLLILCSCISLNAQITQTKTAGTVTKTTGNQEVSFTLVNAASLQAAVATIDIATANATLTKNTGSQYSEFLILRDFNFLVPPTDIDITGVSITITGNAGAANAINVGRVRLIQWTGTPAATPYTIIGTTMTDQGVFPTTEGNVTVGGALSSNFGSPTLTPTTINSSNFGIALQLRNFTGGTGGDVQAIINQISVSVTFQPSAITPLPVEFISIDASKAAKGVQLTWKVGTELNVSHYEVERSTDGVNYKKIGSVYAAQLNNYSFTDQQPVNGIAYYRVRNVDIDGDFKYSTVVKFQNGISATLFKAFPTTTHAQVTLQHPSVGDKAIITVSSLEGRALQAITVQGSASTLVNLSAYPAGMYLLQYKGENGYTETFRILKQ